MMIKQEIPSSTEIYERWNEMGILPEIEEEKKMKLAQLYEDTANVFIHDDLSFLSKKTLETLQVVVFPIEACLFKNFATVYDYDAYDIVKFLGKKGKILMSFADRTKETFNAKEIDIDAMVCTTLSEMIFEKYAKKQESQKNNSNNSINVKFKKIHPDAVIPTYAHDGDVGMDMTAVAVEYDVKNDMYIYHTGLSFESDFNIGQFLFPRSSNRKTDAYLCNHVGIADSAIYRGEILFCFKNRTSIQEKISQMAEKSFDEIMNADSVVNTSIEIWREHFISAFNAKQKLKKELMENLEEIAMQYAPYKVGDRIGQMVFLNYPTVVLTETEELSETERGAGGFGSTGN